MRDPRILALAQAAVAAAGSVTAVAIKIGYNRATLSRYLNEPDYPSPATVEKKLAALLDRITCPHTGQETGHDECSRRANAPKPCGGIARARHWATCQTCPHKPQGDRS